MAIPAVVWSLVLIIVKWLSPVARDAFEKAMVAFYKTAMESENQLDDIAATVICKLMNVDISGVVVSSHPVGTAPKEVVDAVTNGLVEVTMGWSADRPFDPSVDSGP